MFGEMTDQIKIASDAAIKELEKVSKKQLDNIRKRTVEIEKLSSDIDKGVYDSDQMAKTKARRRLASLKGAQTKSSKFEKDYESKKESIETERLKKLKELEERKEKAILAYKENQWKKADINEKLRIIEKNKFELDSEIEKFDHIREYQRSLTAEEEAEYQKLIDDKIKQDQRYEIIQKNLAKKESKSTRYSRYTSEVDKIKEQQRIEQELNRKDNANDKSAYNKRQQEINQQTKESIKKAQNLFGLTSSEISGQQVSSILKGLGNMAQGGVSAEGIMGIASSAGASSAVLSKIAGPLGIIVTVLQSIYSGIKSINQFMENSMQEPIKMQTEYMGNMNARLQQDSTDRYNYYNNMIRFTNSQEELDTHLGDQMGLAIGQWNAYVNKQDYITKLNQLVAQGIADNAEERALIATLSDRMVTTFDVLDQNLTRLVRIQQRDVTYSALGSEALLTQFLNREFSDTSYLNSMYDSVSGILLDAVAKMSADQGSAFQYEVQKWLGSLYSVGLSEQGVQQLAQGLNYLATGDVTQLTSNQQLQYIYAAAAERGGMSLADILTQGLDWETTNDLLSNVVSLLQDIYDNSSTNAVQSAWAGITGMSIADLRSFQNISNDYLTSISSEHSDWARSLTETENQLSNVLDRSRTSSVDLANNLVSNIQFYIGQKLIEKNINRDILGLDVDNESLALEYILHDYEEKIVGDIPGIGRALGGIVSFANTIGEFLDGVSGVTLKDITTDMRRSFQFGNQGSGFFNKSSNLSGLFSGISSDLITAQSSRYTGSTNYDWNSLLYQEGALPDINTLSYLTPYMDSYTQSLFKQALNNQNQGTALTGISDLSYLAPYLDTQTRYLLETSHSIQENQASVTGDVYNDFISSVESLSATTSADLPDLVQQAENAVNSAQTVVNESAEDRALLEEATDVQDYLFENEQTIRVTLALIEDTAQKSLTSALNIDSRTEDLSAIRSTIQNKVDVDLVDDDVNILLNSIERMKWSM